MDVTDKVRKLLALAQSSNVNEAAAAAARAQALIERYRIDPSVIDPNAEDDPIVPGEPSLYTTRGRQVRWRWNLAWAVGSVNGCCPWGEGHRPRRYFFVGKRSDVAAASYLYMYLSKEIDRLARKYVRASPHHGRAAGNSFRIGAVQEVERRLEEARNRYRREALRTARDASELAKVKNAIAVADDQSRSVEAWMAAERGWRYASGSAPLLSDYGAFAAGRAAGAEIHLGGASSSLSQGPRALGDGS